GAVGDGELDRRVRAPASSAAEAAPAPLESARPSQTVAQARRRSRWLIAALLLLLAGGLGLTAWSVLGRRAGQEAERFQKAEKLYKDREFTDAARALQSLVRDFPDSAKSKQYGFLAELSDVREPAYQAQGDADAAYQAFSRVMQFLQVYQGDPLLKAREPDVWQTLYRIAKDLTEATKHKQDRELLERSRRVLAE